ncbi:MAG: glycogen synthase GlgA [Betaproteobacteria bacterium]|nr:glycogen synthase GlgA [Betaproteobacteria bacterium]
MNKLKILFVTSEIAPWVKTGGLGDVCGVLPQALRELGIDVRLLVPYYPALAQAFPAAKRIAELGDLGGKLPPAILRQAKTASGLPLLLLDCPTLFDRPGNPYLDADGRDWQDNALRYGLLSRVAALLGSDANPLPWQAQLIHCHDWQTALAPAYLKYLGGARARTLITVHNLAFQGLFGAAMLAELGLPPQAWQIDGVEYHGYLSFLKGGLQHADWITSVSPTYAREIQTDAEGMGLAGLLRWRSEQLSGILNGIDDDLWNPATDPQLKVNYAAGNLRGKAANKRALQQRMGLAEDSRMPLLGIISRLTEQKGLDLLPPLAAEIAALPAQLAVLGSGDRELEQAFRAMAQKHPGQFAARIGFDEGLAHLIEAGADMFLMPSRFEPCGLNQMYSLRYGTPPVVRSTGGLADSVVDCIPATLASATANGFAFKAPTATALLSAIRRAILAWHEPAIWRQLQHNGMQRDWSWRAPARQYAELYRRLAAA